MTHFSHSHTPITVIHSSNSLSIALSLRHSHSSSRFFFSNCFLNSLSLSTSVWSSNLLFTNVLAFPTCSTSILLHNHIRKDCNFSVLSASGIFGRHRVGRFLQVVWVPVVRWFDVSLALYSRRDSFLVLASAPCVSLHASLSTRVTALLAGESSSSSSWWFCVAAVVVGLEPESSSWPHRSCVTAVTAPFMQPPLNTYNPGSKEPLFSLCWTSHFGSMNFAFSALLSWTRLMWVFISDLRLHSARQPLTEQRYFVVVSLCRSSQCLENLDFEGNFVPLQPRTGQTLSDASYKTSM